MKVKNLSQILLALGALLTPSPSHAQSWTTVDDFKPGTGFAITSDAQGNIYAAGSGTDAQGVGHATVMKSADGGVSWKIVEDFNLRSLGTGFFAIGTDDAGNVYAVGDGMTVNNSKGQSGYWIVRKSSDQGMTWSTVDQFALPGGTYSLGIARGFGKDTLGNIYVVGMAQVTQNGANSSYWIVRKSSDRGSTWTTVDNFHYGLSFGSEARAVICTPSGIFVSGGGQKPYLKSGALDRWLVRRSTNGGATWTTVDEYSYLQNQTCSTFSRAITADPAGNIYVFGNGAIINSQGVSSPLHWLVRKSADNGATWSLVDDFQYQNGTSAPNAGGVDAFGNIYAVGAGAVTHWLVRAGGPGGTAWSLVDDFKYSTGNYASTGMGFAATPGGSLFAIGIGVAADGRHWIARATAP